MSQGITNLLKYGTLIYFAYKHIGPKFLIGFGIGYIIGKGKLPKIEVKMPEQTEKTEVSGVRFRQNLNMPSLPPVRYR